jgi:hypothetical protein
MFNWIWLVGKSSASSNVSVVGFRVYASSETRKFFTSRREKQALILG